MDIIELVKGDSGPELKVELKRADTSNDFVASDATLNLRIRRKGETSVIVTIVADSAKSIPASGILVFSLEDFLTNSNVDEGFYEGEVEVSLLNGTSMSAFDVINIKVRNEFG